MFPLPPCLFVCLISQTVMLPTVTCRRTVFVGVHHVKWRCTTFNLDIIASLFGNLYSVNIPGQYQNRASRDLFIIATVFVLVSFAL